MAEPGHEADHDDRLDKELGKGQVGCTVYDEEAADANADGTER